MSVPWKVLAILLLVEVVLLALDKCREADAERRRRQGR